jgi:hypothetical protein
MKAENEILDEILENLSLSPEAASALRRAVKA